MPNVSPKLTTLKLNWPSYKEISEISTLVSLEIDFSYSGFSFQSKRPHTTRSGVIPPIDGWFYPSSGSLRQLRINAHPWNSDSRLQIHLNQNLKNLDFLSIHAPLNSLITIPESNRYNYDYSQLYSEFKHIEPLTIDFEQICPVLQHLEIDCPKVSDYSLQNYSVDGIEVILPVNLVYLKYWTRGTVKKYPNFARLHCLKQLSLIHYKPKKYYYYAKEEPALSLEPILELKHLRSLQIRSTCKSSIDQNDSFLIQLATSPNFKDLQHLDIKTLSASRISIETLKKYLPKTQIASIIDLDELRSQKISSLSLDHINADIPEYATSSYSYSNKNHDYICQWCKVMIASEYSEDHLTICSQIHKKCYLSFFGCNYSGTSQELRDHIKTCLYYIVSCFDCGEELTRLESHDHSKRHEKILSQVQPSQLSYPAWKIPKYRQVICKSCDNDFDDCKMAMNHDCLPKKVKVYVMTEDGQVCLDGMKRRSTYNFWK